MKKLFLLAAVALLGSNRSAFAQIIFNYTGGSQSYTVPPGTSAICFTVSGAKGQGNVNGANIGGLGGRVMGTLPVVPGQVLQINVGGGGGNTQLGGFNGGAPGGTCNACATSWGGGGGGASDIRFSPFGLIDRQAVGGGGGGNGGDRITNCSPGCGGGGGGGYYGGGGGGAYGGSPGFGGTQVGGGLGGASCCGCPLLPQPGAAGVFGNGGGGGGLTGGNAQFGPNPGCAGGVGGALIGGQGPNCTGGTGCPSTWAGASGAGGSNFMALGVTGPTTQAGVQVGNGQVIINPNCCASPTIVPVANPTAICVGQTATLTVSGAGPGGTYTWQPGGLTATMITVSPTITTIYTVQGTNTGSCTGTQTIQIVVNPLPVVLPGSNSPVCQFASINLNVPAFSTYTWTGPNAFGSNLQNPIIPNAQPVNAGVYTVSVTNASGCSNSGTVNVVVNLAPVTTPTNGGPYCAGATINLSVTAGVSYTWTGPNAFGSNLQNPIIPNAQPINGGIYTVVVAGVGGCAASGTTNVVVNPLPTPTITVNNPVCVGQPINFTGAGGNTYTWTGPGGFFSNAFNPVIAVAQLTNAGTYSLSVTNGNGCTNSVTVLMVVNTQPIMVAGGSTVCLNTTANLSSGGATTYTWSGPNAFVSIVQNPAIPFAQLNMTGNYTVIGTSAIGCTNSAVANILVLPLPIATINSNAPVCKNGTLTLNGSGGSTYSWAGPNGFTSVSQNTTIPNVQLAANGTYTLIATVGICSNMTTAVIVINPLPSPTITSNSAVCLLKTINLFATGGNSFTWAGPNGYVGNGSNLTFAVASNINAGVYTVTATDGNNCINTATGVVIVNPLPVISAVGSTLCAAKTISLSASGGTAYLWAGPNGFASASPSDFIPNSVLSMQGSYSVTVTDANGCITTSVTNVKINPLPTPTVSANTPICSNQTINLSAGDLTAVSYIWTGPNGFISTLQNPVITDANTNTSGMYTVTVADNIGCSAQAMVGMQVNPLPVVTVITDKNHGCVPVCITFSPLTTSSLQSSYWELGDGTNATGNVVTKCYKYAGNYDIKSRFVDVNGCSNTGSPFTVGTDPIPVADFNFESSKPIINETVEFTDASYGAKVTSWMWNFSHLKNQVVLKQNTSLSYETPGTYVVALVVMSNYGCRDTVVKSIIVGDDFGIYIPNSFTPNGDGVNDVFQPKGFGIVKYEFNIFDRWGEKMFSTHDFGTGWDGTYTSRGQTFVKEDVYVWSIKVTNVFGKSKEYSGKVTLIK